MKSLLAATVASGWKQGVTGSRSLRFVVAAAAAFAIAPLAGTTHGAAAALPPGNAAEQWNQIAEDTVVGSGAFQGEGFVYMAYASMAMNRAVSPANDTGSRRTLP
jgi:hypothetical protein